MVPSHGGSQRHQDSARRIVSAPKLMKCGFIKPFLLQYAIIRIIPIGLWLFKIQDYIVINLKNRMMSARTHAPPHTNAHMCAFAPSVFVVKITS